MPGLLNTARHQQLHQMTDVQTCRGGIKTDVGTDPARLQVRGQRVGIGRLGYKAPPSQFIEQCVHPPNTTDERPATHRFPESAVRPAQPIRLA